MLLLVGETVGHVPPHDGVREVVRGDLAARIELAAERERGQEAGRRTHLKLAVPDGRHPREACRECELFTSAEFVVLEMFENCPKDDLLRRALLLRTMTNMAGIESPEGDEFRQPLREKLRKMLADPEEMPQMRIFALDELKDQFGLGDVIWLSRLGRSSDSSMKSLINSFLFEFF